MEPPPRLARRPRAVLFDLFHTLVQVQPCPETGATTWGDLGVAHADWERVLLADRPGRALGRVRCPVEGMRLLAREIDPSIPDERIERAAQRRVQRFDRALERPEPRIVDAVARLRTAGVRIALCSNAAFDEVGAWPRSPFAAHFDAAVFSCEVAAAKPDPAIYRHALGRVGAAPGDAVFVGDGGSDELRGARAAGMSPVLVTRMAESLRAGATNGRRAHADRVFDDVAAFADDVLGEDAR